VDGAGNVYVAGYTGSADFPTVRAVQAQRGGGVDAFAFKLREASSLKPALAYSTYLGGSDFEVLRGVTADARGNTYVVGYTNSIDFPVANPAQGTHGGGEDGFVTKISPDQITVTIDVSPGSKWNYVVPQWGVISVAILTTEAFDATTVDDSTVRLGPSGAKRIPSSTALRDVDRDGDTDVVLVFRTRETGIKCGAKQVTLVGATLAGEMFTGYDAIRTILCSSSPIR